MRRSDDGLDRPATGVLIAFLDGTVGTFDCYGTLIDWDAGISTQLRHLFPDDDTGQLLEDYHRLEPAVQREDPTRSYREVLELALSRLAGEAGLELRGSDRTLLAESVPEWGPFPEVAHALREARNRGWRLAVLSNTDPDLIGASIRRIGVTFDEVIVASEIQSYKPAHGHWEEFFARTDAAREHHVHVAASIFHDIEPAAELGLHSIWINRTGERVAVAPTRELRDLSRLPAALDSLVPA